MSVAALIVAAGRGTRAGTEGALPKQYARLGGKSVLEWSLLTFADHHRVDLVQVVIHPDDVDLYRPLTEHYGEHLLPPVFGGSSRQASVRLGLEALATHGTTRVLIHDAARPFVNSEEIDGVLDALERHPGAILAIPLSDSLKRAAASGTIAASVDRAGLWRAQTPQGFHFDAIRSAHERASNAGRDDFTDDAAVAQWAGMEVALVASSERNRKLTTAEDLVMAQSMIRGFAPSETRTGTGFDVHRFAPGASVWLCGVEIPHTQRLEGHSDADVGLHALTDALLGAIGAGDIGQHFPPSDMRWKDAASHIFLAHAASLVTAKGGRIVNVDVTILAEAPRVSPHRAAMCARIAEILAIDASRVSVKATTTEGLGFTGRREGIAAMATASVALPAT